VSLIVINYYDEGMTRPTFLCSINNGDELYRRNITKKNRTSSFKLLADDLGYEALGAMVGTRLPNSLTWDPTCRGRA